MNKQKFTTWCDDATYQIQFKPDRQRVHRELLSHLEDRKEHFLAQGLSEEEAAEQALEAMGNPDEIAENLGKIHSPFWGYMLRASRIALILLLCISLFTTWRYTQDLQQPEKTIPDFDVYSTESYGGDTGRTLLHLSEHNLFFIAEGNLFAISDSALFTVDSSGSNRLYLRIVQKSFLPQKKYHASHSVGSIMAHFTAQDNLGNEYCSYFDWGYDKTPHLSSYGTQTGMFTYTYNCWINDFPADAQWIDICYERDGRNYSLRVHLTGGDGT